MKTKQTIIERLEKLIVEADQEIESITPYELAEYLAGRSVIALPVEIGQEVYAVCPGFFEDEMDVVEPWKVQGIKLGIDGKLYAIDGGDEEYEIGTDLCCLTGGEAEEYLRKAELGE